MCKIFYLKKGFKNTSVHIIHILGSLTVRTLSILYVHMQSEGLYMYSVFLKKGSRDRAAGIIHRAAEIVGEDFKMYSNIPQFS